jgi:transcriptional regulator with XRE-family HTH domain
MDFKKRVETLAGGHGLSVKELCEKSGISHNTMQNYTARGRLPNVETLIKLNVYTGVNIHWLLTGQGDMYRRADTLPDMKRELCAVVDQLSSEQQAVLLALGKLFAREK